MNLHIKEVTCDTSENNQHSSLTNYMNCEHPFLANVHQNIYCIVSQTITWYMGVSKTIQQGCHYELSIEYRILKIFGIHNSKKTVF